MTDSTGDPNMAFALSLAIGLGTEARLPQELQEVEDRARFVDRIDGPLLAGDGPYEMAAVLGQRIREIAEICRKEIQSVAGELDRLSIALRLWSGCISAAKTIALETRSGPNTDEIRRHAFEEFIDPAADSDDVFLAGVEAAPAFKALRGEAINLDGVPKKSAVWNYLARIFHQWCPGLAFDLFVGSTPGRFVFLVFGGAVFGRRASFRLVFPDFGHTCPSPRFCFSSFIPPARLPVSRVPGVGPPA